MLVTPAEAKWIIQHCTSDATRALPLCFAGYSSTFGSILASGLFTIKAHTPVAAQHLFVADSGFNPFNIERNFLSELAGFFPG